MDMDLPAGERCFVDANVLAYALTDVGAMSAPCRALMQRVALGEITAYSSMSVFADAVYKTMLAESMLRFGLAQVGVRRWLERHPQRFGELTTFAAAAETLVNSRIVLLQAQGNDLLAATRLSRAHGLLVNDALIMALMEREQIRHLMTNDDDFDAIQSLTVHKPR